MILSIANQSHIFILTVALGFIIGFVYDIFRIIRKTFKHPDFLTQLEDLIYWLLVSFLMFYFMLNNNNGEIRAFNIIGVLLGMLLYFLTLSILIVKVSVTIIQFIEKIIAVIIKIFMIPIKLIISILQIPLRFLHHILKKIQKPAKKVLQNSSRYAKIRKAKVLKDFKIIFKKV